MSAPVHVLLIEDSLADADLTRECFGQGKRDVVVHHALDAVEGLAFLRRQGEHSDAPLPRLVLLDINLPKITGHQFLDELRRDPLLRSLPVVVLSSSTSPAEIRQCYEAGANAYISKPVGFHEFLAAVSALEAFWFDVATVPTGEHT